jgi:hypothetical protein
MPAYATGATGMLRRLHTSTKSAIAFLTALAVQFKKIYIKSVMLGILLLLKRLQVCWSLGLTFVITVDYYLGLNYSIFIFILPCLRVNI